MKGRSKVGDDLADEDARYVGNGAGVDNGTIFLVFLRTWMLVRIVFSSKFMERVLISHVDNLHVSKREEKMAEKCRDITWVGATLR